MEQILFAVGLLALGSVSLLEKLGVVELVSWWGYVSPLLLMLLGLFMILRVQGRMAARKAEKQGQKEKEQVEKELEEKHVKENTQLTKELNDSKEKIAEQDEVIDDLVNPKTPPSV